MAKPKSNHYVSNKEFLEHFIEWKTQLDTASVNGTPPPVMPRYLGECIIKIANHLAFKANFINYSYRNDMIGDAIENCSRVLHKFNPERSSNIFAYTTQICYNAFLRRIEAEKKQSNIKGKLIQEIPIDELFDINPDDADEVEFRSMYMEFMKSNSFSDSTKMESSKRKKNTDPELMGTLEKFICDDE